MMLINTCHWPQVQYRNKIIFSPNPVIFDYIQKHPDDLQFWRHIHTAFVCIIYDPSQKKITAVRDHFGVEPCYYCYNQEHFIFGSTIPAVLNNMQHPPQMNLAQISDLFFHKLFNAERYSDETYYQSIYRLEPGHELQLDFDKSPVSCLKSSFWDLKQLGKSIHYTNTEDYVAHFSELLNEAFHVQVGKEKKIAAEFSGGLDSTAVVAAAFHNHLQPPLFTHVANPGSQKIDDMSYGNIVIQQLGIKNITYIDGKDFDLESSMRECAHYFAGASPYVGFVLTNSLHRTVANQGFNLLLSGIGGDECVSSHAPLRVCVPQMIHEHDYKKAWHELSLQYQAKGSISPSGVKKLIQLLSLSFPTLTSVIAQLGDLGYTIQSYLKNYPYSPRLEVSRTLPQHEYNLLQGTLSHHLRMRVEYNSVLAKAMGFKYVFPLLYPKLVEFCYQLPLEQKRNNGINRLMIRNYLAQFFPPELYRKHSKTGGVTPAVLDKIQQLYDAGSLNSVFHNLPFQNERDHIHKHAKLQSKYPFRQDIPAYMFKAYWESILYSKITNTENELTELCQKKLTIRNF